MNVIKTQHSVVFTPVLRIFDQIQRGVCGCDVFLQITPTGSTTNGVKQF